MADLITFIHGNSPYAKVVIYEQMADGGFEPPKTYDTYDTPASSVTGDMDRNGTLDLVLMNTGYGTFTMHYQSLEGVFGAMTIIPAGDVQSHPFNIFSAIGDVTGDGKMDVVYLGFNDGLVVVAQGGAPNCPTITPPRARMPFFSYAVINSIEANEAVAADIDGDGRDDVLTLVQSYPNPEDSYVQVINQTVNGAFTLGNQIPMGTNAPLVGLSTGDINNDGRVDISTVTQYSWGPPGVYLAVQQEDGNFNRPVAMGNIPNAKQTYIADWTGDGLDDLAVIGDNGINIFAQLADGTLADPITYAQGQLGGTNLNDVTDWNGDGRMDIVAWWRNQTIPGDKPVRIFLQRQDGGFDLLPTIMYANIHTIAAGDIDNNSKPDIVMSHPDNVPEARMGLVYQQPDGTMAESIILSDRKYNLPGSFVISDLNFDGLNDLLVFNFGYFGTTVFTQNKQHTFDSALYYNLFTGNQDFGHSVTKIDTNHDNKPDIFVYVTNDNRVLFIKPLVTSDLFLPLIKR